MEFESFASSSRGNLYRVRCGSAALLLEAGLPLREIRRRLGWTVSTLDGCLLTHEHMDHARGAADLLRMGMPIWCSPGTAEELELDGHSLHLVRSGDQARIGAVDVLALEAQHDAAEPLAWLLADGQDKLLFATDTAYLQWRFVGLTMIAIECSFASDLLPADMPQGQRARLEASHMSLASVLELLAANDLSAVREIHLLHLSQGHADAARFQRTIEEATGCPVTLAAER